LFPPNSLTRSFVAATARSLSISEFLSKKKNVASHELN